MLNAFLAALASAGAAVLFGLAVALRRPLVDPESVAWSHRVPVAGGQQPHVHAWSRFHVRYYPMTLVFIAFEMEMMFMYPWAVVYVREGTKALVEMGMFLTLLSIGIGYAWRERALSWQ